MSDAMLDGTLWLVGAGNMGGAMLDRWIDSGVIAADRVVAIDPGSPRLPAGVRHAAAPPGGESPDILVLAVKPQMLAPVAATLAHLRPRLLVSILAGVEVAALGGYLAADAIVRAMPNLPVALGKGVVALHAADPSADVRAATGALMAPLGLVEWIDDEAMFHAVTALSGCGPGFVYRFIQSLADAAEGLGVPADQAARLALATVEGAAALAAVSDASPAILADRVASPGGVTREGLNVLDRDAALARLLADTLAAAEARSREMADAAG